MNAIEINHLTKYYGTARGVIDLSLAIKEGDFFGFIGPNGAGKSTTIRQLLGLITPSSGTASIFAKDCTKDSPSILKEIGYMPSEAMFYNDMKVGTMIKLSADLHKKDCRDTANKLCERFQLDINKKISELSLGNRKKVSIVCAMQHNPKLFILDEPTSGLDPLMQKEFFDTLSEYHQKGATIFLSSHVLPEIKRHCTNAAIIRDGRLIANTSVAELSKSDTKKVTLQGVTETPRIPSIRNLESFDQSVSFLYQGDLQLLIHSLQGVSLTDITITDLDLDEIFMHFYETQEEAVR